MNVIEDPRSALMQSLLGGTADGVPSIQDLLAKLGATDPTAAMVLQYMAQQRAAASEEPDEGEQEETAAVVEAPAPYMDEGRAARAGEALRALRRRVHALYAELEDLRARNDDLAAALGACAQCWGEDPACETCEGLGRPGGAPPDAYLYGRLVAPAARRLNYWDPADGRLPGAGPPTTGTTSERQEERRPE